MAAEYELLTLQRQTQPIKKCQNSGAHESERALVDCDVDGSHLSLLVILMHMPRLSFSARTIILETGRV